MATFTWPSGWDPLAGLRIVQRELERLGGRGGTSENRRVGGGVYPPVNVYHSSEEILVEAELAGVDRDDIDLSITGETLVIKGVKTPPDDEQVRRCYRSERGSGNFTRTIVLPDKVDPENISANLEHGILTIRLPKSEAARPRQIKVS